MNRLTNASSMLLNSGHLCFVPYLSGMFLAFLRHDSPSLYHIYVIYEYTLYIIYMCIIMLGE